MIPWPLFWKEAPLSLATEQASAPNSPSRLSVCCTPWCATQDFYKNVVLQKLNPGGIFITQSGPAGFLSCTEVFTCINATLRSVFPHVVTYAQHMPVFCDVWGYNMALTDPQQAALSPEEMDTRIASRIEGPLRFLDGETFRGICHMNKHVRK
jgi:thermospermine synthase